MFRSQNRPYSATFPASPIPLLVRVGVGLQPRDFLRVLVVAGLQTRPPLRSRAFLPPTPAIPFRITFFAHPYHLTPIESYSCKKQGRGWHPQHLHPTQCLPSFSTPSKRPTRRNTPKSNPSTDLLTFLCIPRGGGGATIFGYSHQGLSIYTSQVTGHGTPVMSSLRVSAHSASLRYPFPRFSFQPTVDCLPGASKGQPLSSPI